MFVLAVGVQLAIFLFLFRCVEMFLLVEFQLADFVVVALLLFAPAGFQLVIDRSKDLLESLCLLLFDFGLGEYYQPYINSVSKWDSKIFLFSCFLFVVGGSAAPAPLGSQS